jgi:hypothetical protein
MQFHLHYTSYDKVTTDSKVMAEQDVLGMCPTNDEATVLHLEVGQSHVDEDGDTWERIA